jgi:hypothetical protein
MAELGAFMVIPDFSRNNDPVNEVYSKLKEDSKVKETLLIIEKALQDFGYVIHGH